MKFRLPHLFLTSTLIFSSITATAITQFNQDVNPEVIFGSGNANGSFTTSRNNGVELGLRAKIPMNGNINSTGDGKYYYSLADTDHDNDPATANRWNFDWTINTDFDASNGTELNAYTYELGLDVDPSKAKNFLIFDPVTPNTAPINAPFYDHSIGNNTTGNGQGVEATDELSYFDLLFTQNVLQQSWRYEFFDELAPMDMFDPNVTGSYNIYLLIRNEFGSVVARTEIVVEIIDDRFVTPDIIFGSGNTNGKFTVETGENVEIGLRAKIPYNGNINYNGDGTYSYTLAETEDPAGVNPNRWNFDWAINTDYNDPNSTGNKVGDYTYEMGLDSDPGLNTDFLVFDPITPTENNSFYDHAFGNNSTANGGGTEATDEASYANLLATSNVVQQSWRYAFFETLSPLDTYNPDVPGSYIVYLLARNSKNQVVARTEIQILIEGAPKRTVPLAIDDSYIISEDSTIAVPAEQGLLTNDADADNDSLTVLTTGTFTADGIGGILEINADGSFSYAPEPNANGVATYQYQLTDGYFTVSSTLEVIVKAENDRPTFSIFGDIVLNELQNSDSTTFIYENFIFDFNPGPQDESDQVIERIDVEVISDSDNVLNEVLISNTGTLFFDLNLNYGIAMLEVTVKDNGSGQFIGDAFSDPVPFIISYLDLIFASGFESADSFTLLNYLDKMTLVDKENPTIVYDDIKPYYDFPSNSINFMGHQLRLEDDYNSKKIIMALGQWMEEIILLEELTVQVK